jgi:acyl-CoA thioesterase
MRTANTETRQQVETLLAKDAYAGALGITVIDAAPGAVRVGMTVRADHLNFLDWAHGGVIFALADTAFGLASNSHDTVSVGIDAHMAYLSGVREADVIEAQASEISRTRRKAVYRIDVTRPADGTAIAAFTGTVYVTEQALKDLVAR